ncbi:uncharacterized protein B0J16DRAFT_177580 [Fusarium flagelliforme]|uniref:Uncharacterized protein n=1 Tax=Fusarium flagelliforme TaxID=2675880 RepID=A0A395N2H5_9HYPO|nr:uncharacterized protein B0J16DRAFT_177580 [Fusarium flagelliforme]KAH7179806.1 hypothetical protein B0J16DRAFT_177580 [Fusarium flagelliforme]RFN53769.1 hypothetical protein FIE12Z_1941 [Fusarium flagelliforme]
MSLRLAPRKVASKALLRSSRLECPSRCNPRSPPTCAFSTTIPNNRRINNNAAPSEKPSKVRVTSTTSDQSSELQQRLQEKSAALAREREEQLREARQRRLDRIKEEREKREQGGESERKVFTKKELEEEKEKKEKEDYKKRYKQLERNWLKFMVGMPIFLVTSYDLFQRLVMKREPKVPPWKQAKINKEKEEKEQQEKLEKEGEVLLKD